MLRHVRHPLYRPSGSAAHPDVGAVSRGISTAKGLSAARPLQPVRAAPPGARAESRSQIQHGRALDRRGVRGSAGRHEGPAGHRRKGGRVAMATKTRTVDVKLSTTGLDSRGRAQRVPLATDEAGNIVPFTAPPPLQPELQGEHILLNLRPHHPATHAVLPPLLALAG